MRSSTARTPYSSFTTHEPRAGAKGLPRDVSLRSMENALNFSLWHEDPSGTRSQVGFAPLADPSRWMERWTPDAYVRPDSP